MDYEKAFKMALECLNNIDDRTEYAYIGSGIIHLSVGEEVIRNNMRKLVVREMNVFSKRIDALAKEGNLHAQTSIVSGQRLKAG
jgi:hypothetical protein